MSSLLKNVFREKCPFCGQGDVFIKKSFWRIPEMHPECPVCKRDLTGEPGYFFGAMYVSYAISVLAGIITFVLCKFVFGVESLYLLIGIIAFVIIVISYKNFKWSRIVWLKIFPPGANTNFYKKQ